MSKYRRKEKKFLLKDMLFNKVKVERLANEIKSAYPVFKSKDFIYEVLNDFPKQELMQRIIGIRNQLYKYLPEDYSEAIKIILKALPEELDPNNTDNDFGDFIYAPYSYYVAEYGCNKKDLKISFKALEEITKRFSAEAALRDFLNKFPEETFKQVYNWSVSKNYHVRRLASEGTRPNLPWAKKIKCDPKQFMSVLDVLHIDSTRYVTRSVANHLNDVSKVYPDLVIDTLIRWKKAKKQNQDEIGFIIKHALRTLIKNGNQKALKLLGLGGCEIEIREFKIHTPIVNVGRELKFSMAIKSKSKNDQRLRINYLIFYRKANGSLSPKVFNLTDKVLKKEEELNLNKSHIFKPMSTRVLYAGEHSLEIQINGKPIIKGVFVLS
jgi:3-methyladenine DNA glycosylase AlkC